MQVRNERSKAPWWVGTVGTDQAAAVEREDDRQILQRHIMHQLIVAALQEGRVDRQDRPQPLAGESGGEGHGVLLGDADVVIAFRVAFAEAQQAGAFTHRRGDADQFRVGRRHVAQPVAEDLRIAGLAAARPAGDADLGLNFETPW
jgi:hypothetical protein